MLITYIPETVCAEQQILDTLTDFKVSNVRFGDDILFVIVVSECSRYSECTDHP